MSSGEDTAPAPSVVRGRGEGWVLVAGLVGLAGAVVWYGLTPIAGNDIWWHLSLGREIIRSGGLVDHEVFSYTFEGAAWPYKDAGAAVLQYGAYQLGGAAGLVVLKTLLFLGITGLVAVVLLRVRRVPAPVALLGLCLVVPAMAFRVAERAELFSFLLFVGVLLII